jgi:hypothetical protein
LFGVVRKFWARDKQSMSSLFEQSPPFLQLVSAAPIEQSARLQTCRIADYEPSHPVVSFTHLDEYRRRLQLEPRCLRQLNAQARPHRMAALRLKDPARCTEEDWKSRRNLSGR